MSRWKRELRGDSDTQNDPETTKHLIYVPMHHQPPEVSPSTSNKMLDDEMATNYGPIGTYMNSETKVLAGELSSVNITLPSQELKPDERVCYRNLEPEKTWSPQFAKKFDEIKQQSSHKFEPAPWKFQIDGVNDGNQHHKDVEPMKKHIVAQLTLNYNHPIQLMITIDKYGLIQLNGNGDELNGLSISTLLKAILDKYKYNASGEFIDGYYLMTIERPDIVLYQHQLGVTTIQVQFNMRYDITKIINMIRFLYRNKDNQYTIYGPRMIDFSGTDEYGEDFTYGITFIDVSGFKVVTVREGESKECKFPDSLFLFRMNRLYDKIMSMNFPDGYLYKEYSSNTMEERYTHVMKYNTKISNSCHYRIFYAISFLKEDYMSMHYTSYAKAMHKKLKKYVKFIHKKYGSSLEEDYANRNDS